MAITGADKERSYQGDYMQDGKRAEEIVMEFLRQNPHVVGVDDLRDLRPLQQADVDCSITLMNGTIALAEIKSDKHMGITGNVLFEVLRINHTSPEERSCVLGWSARSPATWFLIFSPSVNKVYQCRAAALRRVLQQYTRKARRNTKIAWVETDSIKTTLNFLMPWAECEAIFHVYDVSDIVSRFDVGAA